MARYDKPDPSKLQASGDNSKAEGWKNRELVPSVPIAKSTFSGFRKWFGNGKNDAMVELVKSALEEANRAASRARYRS
jgi:hypothetical protein